jgi:diamine N-acetyltransferase
MIIRPATLADAPALAAFGDKTFFDTFGHLYPHGDADFFSQQRFSLERTRADISEIGRYIQLAFVEDQLIGFLDCGPLGLPVVNPAATCLELYRLYVDSVAKGTGLAHELMKMALAWARDNGANSLYLGVYHDNGRALAFYRKYGFEIIGAYQFKVGNTLDDERIMELKLN